MLFLGSHLRHLYHNLCRSPRSSSGSRPRGARRSPQGCSPKSRNARAGGWCGPTMTALPSRGLHSAPLGRPMGGSRSNSHITSPRQRFFRRPASPLPAAQLRPSRTCYRLIRAKMPTRRRRAHRMRARQRTSLGSRQAYASLHALHISPRRPGRQSLRARATMRSLSRHSRSAVAHSVTRNTRLTFSLTLTVLPRALLGAAAEGARVRCRLMRRSRFPTTTSPLRTRQVALVGGGGGVGVAYHAVRGCALGVAYHVNVVGGGGVAYQVACDRPEVAPKCAPWRASRGCPN